MVGREVVVATAQQPSWLGLFMTQLPMSPAMKTKTKTIIHLRSLWHHCKTRPQWKIETGEGVMEKTRAAQPREPTHRSLHPHRTPQAIRHARAAAPRARSPRRPMSPRRTRRTSRAKHALTAQRVQIVKLMQQLVIVFGRSADAGWDWGPRCSSGLGFRFTPVKDRESGAISAMQLLCRHPNHRAEGVCTKRRNTHAGVDIVIRQLKWWALQGLHTTDREAHRDLWKAIEETPVTELLEDSVLSDQCPRSFDGAA